MTDVLPALEACLSPDKAQREQALQWLEAFSNADLPNFLVALVNELKNPARSPQVRQQAGLQLKNALTSKEETVAEAKAALWRSFDEALRTHIKQSAMATLGTEEARPSTAAQVLSAIAIAELPQGMWTTVMSELQMMLQREGVTEAQRVAILETMGYICEGVNPVLLVKDANSVLTTLVHSMRADEPSLLVKAAATTALLNSLEFCKLNFDQEHERHVIMQVVCETTQCADSRVRVTALECLVKIMSLYYKHMEHYMRSALFGITVEAMKSEDENVSLQGIEFWATVCEEEIDLELDASEVPAGEAPPASSHRYSQGALPYITPILLELMARQEESDDSEEWNVSKAASVCLSLAASATHDEILKHVVTFVQTHVQNPAWQYRDAAIMAFGSVLEGPSEESLSPLVESALGHIITMMQDPSAVVRDSVAWLLSRVIDLMPDAPLSQNFFVPLVQALLAGLSMESRVSANCCWGLRALAEGAYEKMEDEQTGDVPDSYQLSPYFEGFVGALFQVADRPDANEDNLRCAAYEALMSFVQYSAEDCYPSVKKCADVVIQRLHASLSSQIAGREHLAQLSDIQTQLCALLQVLLKRLKQDDVARLADPVMQIFLAVFHSASASHLRAVQEDALMAMSALIDAVKENFAKYVSAVNPFLLSCLRVIEEHQVCFVAVGVVGDVCRALGHASEPYCAEYMTALVAALQEPRLHRNVKPQILSCFGDIASAIGPAFKPYLDVTLGVLQQASAAAMEHASEDDYDLVDHINDLRQGCLEAYTGVLSSLRSPSHFDSAAITPHVPHILAFIDAISRSNVGTEENIRTALGLVGDLCEAFGAQLAPVLPPAFTDRLIALGKGGKEKSTKELAKWARKQIQSIRSGAPA